MNDMIYSVGEVNDLIKELLDGDARLMKIFVRGELSNYKIYPSGHHYFTIKDSEATLRAVMFRREADRLRFRPENGMRVIAMGRVSVFPRDGQYQLYCAELTPDGVGDLHVAFEQLKEKLFKEGLFDERHKKPLPKYPLRIAVITSAAGAMRADYRAGDIVVLKDHINLIGGSCLRGAHYPFFGERFPDMSRVYDRDLRRTALALARKKKIRAREGVYVAVSGPAYETPVEVRAFRKLGGDIVGMSVVPEATAARQMGVRVLALSYIANAGAGVSARTLSHKEVLKTGAAVSRRLGALLAGLVEKIGGRPAAGAP